MSVGGRFAFYREGFDRTPVRWRPSIHMPRWASRIDLLITGIRIERLQAITAAEVVAEGLEVPDVDYRVPEDPRQLDAEREAYARGLFRDLWDKINGSRENGTVSWNCNPWVWRIEFELRPTGPAPAVERPILFKGPLVRAILEGRKTVTRRLLTRLSSTISGCRASETDWAAMDFNDAYPDPGLGAGGYLKVARPCDETRHRVRGRYALKEGLWVREAHALCEANHWPDLPHRSEGAAA